MLAKRTKITEMVRIKSAFVFRFTTMKLIIKGQINLFSDLCIFVMVVFSVCKKCSRIWCICSPRSRLFSLLSHYKKATFCKHCKVLTLNAIASQILGWPSLQSLRANPLLISSSSTPAGSVHHSFLTTSNLPLLSNSQQMLPLCSTFSSRVMCHFLSTLAL